MLRVRTGHDFSQYKRATVLRRLGRRMQVTGVTDLPAYLALLHTRADEVQALLQDLLISVTNFFRDPAAWTALEAVLPRLFAGKAPGDAGARVGGGLCHRRRSLHRRDAAGRRHCARCEPPPAIQVFATDIDDDAIAQARQGIYPEAIAGDITPERLAALLHARSGPLSRAQGVARAGAVRAAQSCCVTRRSLKLDLITCRNLLIYLNRAAQEQVLQTFHYSLRPDGVLLLGSSESVDSVPTLFTVADAPARLFQRRNLPAAPPPLLPSRPAAPRRRPPARARRRDQLAERPPSPAAGRSRRRPA